jgi:lipopolysaccharide/colanic/teichoic acid biosynthesis glycosyltransferase
MQTIKAHEAISPMGFPPSSQMDAFARRVFDLVVSFTGLVVLLPVFAIIAWAIKRDTPGPVFFRGLRAGRYGKPFKILKFRTMYERPDSYLGPRVTAAGDTRITPLGLWLRNTKINELPQLWNVLRGEMSFVGPRPEDLEIAQTWPPELAQVLLSVRPGITSPATVTFRSEEQILNTSRLMDDYMQTILPDKLRLDSIYVRSRNLLSDLDVIFMTLIMLLPKLRSHQVPETLLYWGPLAQFFNRYMNWLAIDTLAAFAVVTLTGLIWRIDGPLNIGLNTAVLIAIAISFCFSLTNALMGLNRVQWRRAPSSEVFPLAVSTGLATCVTTLLSQMFYRGADLSSSGAHLPVSMLLVSGLLAFLAFTTLRYRERLLTGLAAQWLRIRRNSQVMGERVLIVGAGNSSQFATWLFTQSDFARAFSIVGMVDDDPRKQGLIVDGFPVLGATADIPALVSAHDIGLVLFTIANIDDHERQRILKLCRSTHAQVFILPDILAGLRAHFLSGQKFELAQNISANNGD